MLHLIDAQGRVAASAPAPRRREVFRDPPAGGVGSGNSDLMPYFSSSRDRLYYLDGDTDVRYIAVDGSSGLIKRLPVTRLQHGSFAVTADNRQMAVSILDYNTKPYTLRVYLEDIGDGGRHEEILTSTTRYEWVIGWAGDRLVFAAGLSGAQSGPSNPYGSHFGYRLADAHGNFIRELCGPTAASGPGSYGDEMGRIYREGVVCGSETNRSMNRWDGASQPLPTAACGTWLPVEFSPRFDRVLCAEQSANSPTVVYHVVSTDEGKELFSRQLRYNGAPTWFSWLDDNDVILQTEIVHVLDSTVASLPSAGQVVWRVPGDLS